MDHIEKEMIKSRDRLVELHDTLCALLLDYHNIYTKFIKRPTPYAAKKLSIQMRKTAKLFKEYKKEFRTLRPKIALKTDQRRELARYRQNKRVDILAQELQKKEMSILSENKISKDQT